MSLVADECVEVAASGQQDDIAMEVRRGDGTITLEGLGPAHTVTPISRAPAFLCHENQVVYISLENFAVKQTFVMVIKLIQI